MTYNKLFTKYTRYFKSIYLKSPYVLQKYYFFLSQCWKYNNLYLYSKGNIYFLKKFKRPTFNNKVRFVKFIQILLKNKYYKKCFKIKNNKPGLAFGKRVGFSKRKKKWNGINTFVSSNMLSRKIHTLQHIVQLHMKSKFFYKMITSVGETYYISGPVYIKLFKLYHTNISLFSNKYKLIMPLYNYVSAYRVLTKLSNITLNFSYKIQIATARGSFAVLLYYTKLQNKVKIKLPSKKSIFIHFLMISFLAYIDNDFLKYKNKTTKHGFYRLMGKKNIVRGVAKNPVDHPNGGNTKAKKLYKTPWGKITK